MSNLIVQTVDSINCSCEFQVLTACIKKESLRNVSKQTGKEAIRQGGKQARREERRHGGHAGGKEGGRQGGERGRHARGKAGRQTGDARSIGAKNVSAMSTKP